MCCWPALAQAMAILTRERATGLATLPALAPGGEGDQSGDAPAPAPGGEGDRSGHAPTPAPIASARGLGGSGRGTVLTVRLSEGDAIGGLSSPAVSQVDGSPLDAAEIRSVTERLPPWDDGRERRSRLQPPARDAAAAPHRRDH